MHSGTLVLLGGNITKSLLGWVKLTRGAKLSNTCPIFRKEGVLDLFERVLGKRIEL